MEEVFIPAERIGLLKSDKKAQKLIESACRCKLSIREGEGIIIEGKPYDEFIAKNVIYAFGRGFDMEIARRLLNDDIYFSSIDLRHALGSEKRVARIKARVIGENGRTKRYIESVSSAKMSVYGDTVSFIGDMYEIREAETAVNTLIEGGTHKLAYLRMEAAHRKNKEESTTPRF
jgi:ribosomal RNA assembly protein